MYHGSLRAQYKENTMKKLLLMTAILSLLLSGCAPKDDAQKKSDPQPSEPSLISAEKISQTTITPSLDENSYQIFDRLFAKEDKSKNFILSPLSIQRVLDLMALSTDDREAFAALSVYDENDLQKLDLENSVMESLILLNEKYVPNFPKIPFDNIKLLEFPEPATREKMELQKRVLGEILDSKPIDADSSFVFTDAIRYYAQWLSPFNDALTFDQPFTTADGREIMTPTMFQKNNAPAYVDEDKEIFALHGKENSVVYFIKPKKDPATLDLRSAMKDFKERAETAEVHFHLPKVEFKSTIDLKNSFEALGLGILHQEFVLEKLIPDTPLLMSKATQIATLKIDEKGAEAKASTSMDGNSIALIKTLEIKMDSPYYIVLTDFEKNTRQEIIAFVAYVADPSLTE